VIVTLSGTPGNGKNQIISGLKEYGYNVVSKKGADGTMRGQFTLMKNYRTQMEMCLKYESDEEICIFESSFVDMIVYTALWIGIYDDNMEELKSIREKCIDYQNQYVDLNFNLYSDTSDTTYYNENWNAIANLYYGKKVQIPYLLNGSKSVEYNIKEIIEEIEEHASKQQIFVDTR